MSDERTTIPIDSIIVESFDGGGNEYRVSLRWPGVAQGTMAKESAFRLACMLLQGCEAAQNGVASDHTVTDDEVNRFATLLTLGEAVMREINQKLAQQGAVGETG